jgi:hypothetical protein
MCKEAHWKVFGVWSREEPINKEIVSGPHHPSMSLCCASGFLGRMRETKITNMELNCLYPLWLPGSQSTPLTSWSTSGVVKQHRVREILVRGVTSPCWLSLWDRVLQGT